MLKRKYHLYGVAKFVWLPLSVGATFFVFTGMAEPYVPPPPIPPGYIPPSMFIVGGALAYAGFSVLNSQKARLRRKAWRRAHLRPNGEDEFQGTVRGRPVRVRKSTWRDPINDSDGKNPPATIVEAEMRRPAEEGAVVDVASSTKVSSLSDADPKHVLVEDDALAAVGESEDLARALLSGRSREALLALDTIGKLRVGKTSTLFHDPVGGALESVFGEDTIEMGLGGDASTVTHKLKGLVLDSDELQRQVDAVAAVANAYEKAAAESQRK